MDVIFSTRNSDKMKQVLAAFEGSPINILSLADAGIEGSPPEGGRTLDLSASRKALFAWERGTRDMWTMGEATGLLLDALDGEPGVRSSSWAGATATTAEITRYTLEKLKGAATRAGAFCTAVVVVSPSQDEWPFRAEVRGTMLESERVRAQPMMPYSGLFLPDGSDKVWAEMTLEEENAISQRGIVFREVRKFLEERIAFE